MSPCTCRQVRPGLQCGLQPDRPPQLRVGGPCSAVRSPCPPPARHQPSPARPEDQLHASRLVVPVPRRFPALPAVWVRLPKPLPRHPVPPAPEVGPRSWGSQACKHWAEQGGKHKLVPESTPVSAMIIRVQGKIPESLISRHEEPLSWHPMLNAPEVSSPHLSLPRVVRGGCMGCRISLCKACCTY